MDFSLLELECWGADWPLSKHPCPPVLTKYSLVLIMSSISSSCRIYIVCWYHNSRSILSLHKVPEYLSHCRRLFQRHDNHPSTALPAKAVSMPGLPVFPVHSLESGTISRPCSVDVHCVSALDHTWCRTLRMPPIASEETTGKCVQKSKANPTHMESGRHT